AVNDPVAQRQRRCDEPIAPGCGGRILADGDGELGEDRGFELFDRLVRRRLIGDRGQGARLNRSRPTWLLHRPLPKVHPAPPATARARRWLAQDGTQSVTPSNGLASGLSCSKGLPPAAVAISATRSRGCGDMPATANLARVRVDRRTEKNR